MATKNKETKVPEQTAVVQQKSGVLTERPDYLKKGGTAGRENITAEDILLPRLEVVQALSEAWQEDKPGYIPGAKVGDLINSVTKEIYPRPVQFVPVQFKKDFNLWKLRKFGGGFMGSYSTMAEAQAELELRVPASEREQYEILDTPLFFGLIPVYDGETLVDMHRVSLSMPRTKAKHARRLNSLIDLTHEDAYNRVYAIGTTNDKNKQGQEFKNYTIDQLGYPSLDMVKAAEAFYKQIIGGKVNFQTDHSGSGVDDDGASGQSNKTTEY